MKHFDTVQYNSLKYISENKIDELTIIDQYFVYDHPDGRQHELAVDGSKIKVTDENKMQYIIVKIEYMTREVVIN